jgi:hypothetical protein
LKETSFQSCSIPGKRTRDNNLTHFLFTETETPACRSIKIDQQTNETERPQTGGGGRKKKKKERENVNEKDFFSPLLRLKSDNAAGDTASKNARRLMVAQPPRCYRTKGCWCDKIHSTKFRENRKEKWDQWSLLRQAETMHHNTQKNNSDKGVQERLQAHSRSGRLQDERERERETEGGRETRGCLWTIREPRGCRFFATARFSPNSGHSDICLLRISSSPDRQFVDVEFSFHIWIQDLSSISGFRSCS